MLKIVVRQLALLVGSLLLTINCLAATDPVQVFVSVLPQKFFVERIAGEHAKVEVMVGSGQSPETYEPSPKQLLKLATAKVYFSIGVPFEKVWMPHMSSVNDHLAIVDLSTRATAYYNDDQSIDEHTLEDPHIWVSPVLAKLSAEQIMETLVKIDPGNAENYQENYHKLEKELDDLDQKIRQSLTGHEKKSFLVMHPAWGFFAKTYDLEQIAIEHEGKSPSAKSLHKLIKRAEDEKIKVVFIQDQHSSRMAETVASAIGAKVVKLDPLAENYIENIRKVATEIANSFSGSTQKENNK